MEMIPKALYDMYRFYFGWCAANGLDIPIEILPPDVWSTFSAPRLQVSEILAFLALSPRRCARVAFSGDIYKLLLNEHLQLCCKCIQDFRG